MELGANLQTFVAHVESLKNAEDGFSEEYQELKNKSVGYKANIPRTSGQIPGNSKKNRYKDIIPYDETRVELPLLDGVDGTDYINANYLRNKAGKCRVIAAQGPLSSTTCDFWRMVWVHNIQVVVMVARVVEMGKKKCEKYWPDDGSAMKYGEVIIHNDEVDETNLPNFVRRTMRITVGDQTRKLTHFQYLAWPDHGVPDSPKTVMQMLRQVREVVDISVAPMVLHCSAGCGRTGTVAVIDDIWTSLEDGFLENEIDIFGVTDAFRQCRQAIIQTKDQYFYAYKAVLDLIETIRTGMTPGMAVSSTAAPALPTKPNMASRNPFGPSSTTTAPATYENISMGAPLDELSGAEALYVNMANVAVGDVNRARTFTTNLLVPKVNDVFMAGGGIEETIDEEGADFTSPEPTGASPTGPRTWASSDRDTKRTRTSLADFDSMDWAGSRGNRISKPIGPRLPISFTIDPSYPKTFA